MIMSKKLVIILAVILFLAAAVEFIVILFLGASKLNLTTGENSVVVIRIDDVIYDAKKFTDRIDLYKDRDDVKAVVLRIETPGGTVAASQELTSAVIRLREKGKIVVSSIGNVGASGGYYVASQSDIIVANAGSITGSIGVLMEHFDIKQLADKLGIRFDAITSGPMKDAGTYTRPMKPEERAVLELVIKDAYRQFFETVIDGRREAIANSVGAPADDTAAVESALKRIADGRIFTGAQAVEFGLADEIGDIDDAIEIASKKAGIKGEINVINDNPESAWKEFKDAFGMAGKVFSNPSTMFVSTGGLWYLYR